MPKTITVLHRIATRCLLSLAKEADIKTHSVGDKVPNFEVRPQGRKSPKTSSLTEKTIRVV